MHHPSSRVELIEFVRHATLAASSHNTQPWKFLVEPNKLVVLPDWSRRCPEVDPDDHHLHASIGCATENLVLAAEASGLHCDLFYHAAHSSVELSLGAGKPVRSRRFEAIASRQCSRTIYDGGKLTNQQLRQLEEAGSSDQVSIKILIEPTQKEQIAEYVAAGNRAQFGDPRWAAEMKKWIRFNARDAQRLGDGLYGATLGIPDVPAWLGRAVMRLAVSAQSQSDKDRARIQSSGAIIVLFTDVNDGRHWMEAGRSYERLALEATVMGLSTAFINQPVEVSALRAQLATYLGIGSKRPDLLVRVGRSPKMPRSFRRPVDEVLVWE